MENNEVRFDKKREDERKKFNIKWDLKARINEALKDGITREEIIKLIDELQPQH